MNKIIFFLLAIIYTLCLNPACINAQSLDLSFDNDGLAKGRVSTGDNKATAAAIQADGKFVLAGTCDIIYGLGFYVIRYNVDGKVDSSFGVNGVAFKELPYGNVMHSITIQSDGKILVVGQTELNYIVSMVIVRFNTDGTVDNTFDVDGVVTMDINALFTVAYDIVVQNDGKIVVSGFYGNPNNRNIVVVRFNTDGSLDTSFDTDGIVTTSIGTESVAYAHTIQSDGKIIVTGYAIVNGSYDFVLVRYNTDGSLDTNFDVDGIVTTNFGNSYEMAHAIAIQSNGKIVVSGKDGVNYIVARYNTDGSLDTSFDTDGFVITNIGNSDQIFSMALESSGKIIVTDPNVAVRYNTNGSLDNTFNGNGKLTNLRIKANKVLLQSNNQIIIVGYSTQGNNDDFAFVRFNTDGTIDNTIGVNGVVSTDFGDFNSYSNTVAIQTDGKIVTTISAQYSKGVFGITRYNTDGSVDNTFGNNGVTMTHFGNYLGQAASLAIQTDGKLVVAGYTYHDTSGFLKSKIVVVRYNTNGTLDTSFDNDGIVSTFLPYNCDANYVAIQSDGKIVVGGRRQNLFNANYIVLRYNANGSLDNTFYTNNLVGSSYNGAIIIQNDGKVLATSKFMTVRYNTDASLDNTFGNGGYAPSLVSGTSNSILVQPDGKIIIAGYTNDTPYTKICVVRYNSNGTLDNTFDGDGIVTTVIGNGNTFGHSIGLQSDGKIIVVGEVGTGANTDIVLVRYNADGSLDNGFDGDGIMISDFGNRDGAYSVVLQSDDKIVVAGQVNNDFALIRYDNTVVAVEKINDELLITNTYPNPTKESITIEIDSRLIASKYLIVNQLGQVVIQGVFESEKNIIDVQNLVAGVYFLQIEGKGDNVIKIAKE